MLRDGCGERYKMKNTLMRKWVPQWRFANGLMENIFCLLKFQVIFIQVCFISRYDKFSNKTYNQTYLLYSFLSKKAIKIERVTAIKAVL